MSQITIALIIAVIVIILYATQMLPLTVTAMLSSLVFAFVGIISFEDSIVSFGSDALLLVVGAVIMGNALVECGVTKIVGDSIMKVKVLGENERLLILVAAALTAVLSAFLSNSACVAIFMPVLAAVAKSSEGKITVKNTFMAIGIASVAGGTCTLVGSTPQIIANGILAETEGCGTLGFFTLAPGGLVITAIVLAYFCTIGYKVQQKVFDFPDRIPGSMDDEDKPVVIKKKKAIISAAIFGACIVCFIAGIGTVGTVALAGGFLNIAAGCISQKKAFLTMDWTAFFVMGGALGFSKGMNESGAIEMIAEKTVALFGGESANPLIMCYALFILCSILSNLMSNAACSALLTPLGIATALAIGANPVTFVIMIIMGCNVSYCTPISTPPVTMTLQGGYRFMDYVKVGTPLTIVIMAVAPPIIGLIYGL